MDFLMKYMVTTNFDPFGLNFIPTGVDHKCNMLSDFFKWSGTGDFLIFNFFSRIWYRI